jgi:hypothetical protein
MNERIGRDLRVDIRPKKPKNTSSRLYQVALYVECAMEDSQNIDIVVWFDQVSYPVMTVKKNADFARAGELVSVSDLGMVLE